MAHKIEIYTSMHVYNDYSAADPKGAPTRKRGRHLILGQNLPKLHENENWPGGGEGVRGIERMAHKKFYYVDPPVQFILCVCHAASLRCCQQIGFSLRLIFTLGGCVISWE